MVEDCNLCRELRKGRHIVYKDDYCFAIVAKWPIKRGHIMVLPARHVSDVSDLSEKEAKSMFKAISLFQKAFPKLYGKDAIVIQNPVERRTEAHIHYHILPTSAGIRGLFSKFEGTPYREDASQEDMDKMAEEIMKEVICKSNITI